MKKIIALLGVIMVIGFAGCSSDKPLKFDVYNSDNLTDSTFGIYSLVEIGNYLYYDSTTLIVYWWNGYITNQDSITPSPYYAPNGLPYKYEPVTNTLMEIVPDLSITE